MNNYFGIGLDAKIALDFHKKREDNPKKCRYVMTLEPIEKFAAEHAVTRKSNTATCSFIC